MVDALITAALVIVVLNAWLFLVAGPMIGWVMTGRWTFRWWKL